MITNQKKLDSLKDLLLSEEREYNKKLFQRLNTVESILEHRERLSERVSPIIEEHIDDFSKSIPETLGPEITKALRFQIENSKNQVVEALFPIVGKMIKRYMQNEIALLSEKVTTQVNYMFSLKILKLKIKSIFKGIRVNDLILSELLNNEIYQLIVINKTTGIILGEYSKEETIDKDMISGMLTAIKNFVEDAFKKGGQSLETIEYESFNIHIKNFHTYYIATIISGTITENFKNKLDTDLINIAQKINNLKESKNKNHKINAILKTHFKL